ncbi:polymer-forming cytoskeletal protein [Parvibaculum sp.]|uniref:bactofilin family protein n=1 Tax=Parvibaculum sp. TaxID=2024848 RepID=UPI00320E72EE
MNTDLAEPFSSIASATPPKEGGRKMVTGTVRVLRAGSEDIVVGENSSLEGSFETQGSMFVDGTMSHADLRTSLLSIGVAGSVEGSAHADRAEIAGRFEGQLIVSGEVILRSSSHVTGEIQCGKLISHRGATIKAEVTVVEDEDETGETGGDLRAFAKLPLQANVSRSFLRRSVTFGYGVFFTLGAIGLVSLVMH